MNAKNLSNMTLEDAFDIAKKLPPVVEALLLIGRELPPEYCYHSLNHTHDVIHESLRFGKADKLTDNDLKLIVVAAAWHDIGFIVGRADHEQHGVELFNQYCKDSKEHGLSSSDIETISQLIRDTKLFDIKDGVTQIPSISLSRYLLDADLSNLGREDFFDCLDLLCTEHQAERYDYYRQTLDFIARHTWHTEGAKGIRLQQEISNTYELARRIRDQSYLLTDSAYKPRKSG